MLMGWPAGVLESSCRFHLTVLKMSYLCPCPLQFGLLNIQLKDLQKQLTTVQAEKSGFQRERDEGRAEVSKLQAKLQAAALQVC